jgi:spermidine/putrescine transport system permease protein
MIEARETPGPLEYLRRWPLRLWLAGTALFLYLPLVVMIVFSFNASKRTTVWRGFSLEWYRKLFEDGELLRAFGNSLTIAALSTIISLALGTLAALLLWRFRFPGRAGVEATLALPIVVPEICLGVAFLVFFTTIMPWPTELLWPLDLGAITIAHVSFSFSFVALVVRARLASFDLSLQDAARDLGAGEWAIFRDILLPHLKPGLIAGALLAFTLSLDDFVITFFTSGPDTVTFPILVYSMVRFSVTPEVNAASTLLIVFTAALTAAALRLQGSDIAKQAA